MKRFKNVPIVLSAALLAGMITFASCKKDKDEEVPAGTKAANELCDCLKKAGLNETKSGLCLINILSNYQSYIEKDDATFNKDLEAALMKCDADTNIGSFFELE